MLFVRKIITFSKTLAWFVHRRWNFEIRTSTFLLKQRTSQTRNNEAWHETLNTHAHTLVFIQFIVGTFHRHNDFYTVRNVSHNSHPLINPTHKSCCIFTCFPWLLYIISIDQRFSKFVFNNSPPIVFNNIQRVPSLSQKLKISTQ